MRRPARESGTGAGAARDGARAAHSRAVTAAAAAEGAGADAAFSERVYAMVRRVPRGRVVSYGGIAALLGHPRAARGVGRALNALPDDTDVPWWRVVNRNGEISIRGVLHGATRQRRLLERERVRFDGAGRIDWRRYGWQPEDQDEA